ncbi:hypothetical protein RN001_012680 [Aquatica leii]|uniref:Acyl-coenzyme A oxidase n=1 Tax=Aquatica leii TaxID=1421715 RepID=A0AAN7QFH0_9COLE|nr:hypothetical protein RN001_012680 [Aquatica leii]
MNIQDLSFIEDLPSGELDFYRKQATFHWKKLKLVFEDPERIKTKLRVWKALKNDQAFQTYDCEFTLEQQRRLAALQLSTFRKHKFLPDNIQTAPLEDWLRHFMTVGQALLIVSSDAIVKIVVDLILAQMSVILLGNESHKEFAEAAWKSLKPSAFALTEVAHGSDTKNMKTTATYDESTEEFVLNTPNFLAAKCWLGNLSASCTMAVVFAQLHTKGLCYGLHAFMVPIRDPKTHVPYPGLTIKDCGKKVGLNGVDNGVLMFHNYRIPRSYLLNKYANVTSQGEYLTNMSSPGRVFSSTIGNLSTGRASVIQESSEYLSYAVTIAVRYAAVRKQFGPDKETEIAIIEHQLHQWRVFPYLAAAAVLKVFATKITEKYITLLIESTKPNSTLESSKTEIHVVLSAAKPLTTWTCQDAIQQCREACGGHGFLEASGIGTLRNTNDVRVTYEGDNNILLQQTGRWLLKQWNGLKEGVPVDSPLNTCSFLNNHVVILIQKCSAKNIQDVQTYKFLEESYQWLITYLLQESDAKLMEMFEASGSLFTAFNDSQVYKTNVLSKVYIEYVVLTVYWLRIQEKNIDENVTRVLKTLGTLYGLWCLEKHLVYFYEGNFSAQCPLSKLIRDAILDLCKTLKRDAVSVVDALAFPDFVLNSVLGKSDGKVYEHLQAEFFKDPAKRSEVPEFIKSKL